MTGVCEHCGGEMPPRPAGLPGRKPRFCSTRCRVAAWQDANRGYYSDYQREYGQQRTARRRAARRAAAESHDVQGDGTIT